MDEEDWINEEDFWDEEDVPELFEQKRTTGCLTALVGGASILTGISYGIYEIAKNYN